MLYDLNIPWTPQTSPADLERTLRFSQSLGYDVVALNHTFGAPIPAQVTNPIPRLPAQNSSSSSAPAAVLRRATVLVSDPSTNHRLAALAAVYDLLALRPTTERAFAAACTGTGTDAALISLDLAAPAPFRFRPKPCMAAVSRGVLFELCYAQFLAADARGRAAFIGNVVELVRATRGRGLVLSSGGGTLRAPADVVNLFAVWGLGPERGLEGLGVNARSVVVNEGLKRRAFRGVVDVVDAEGKVPGQKGEGADGEEGQKRGDAGGGGGGGNQKKDKGGRKQTTAGRQKPSQEGNGKRKHDGGGDHGGGGGAGGDQASLPVMSKRQAKKMKLAEKNASVESAT